MTTEAVRERVADVWLRFSLGEITTANALVALVAAVEEVALVSCVVEPLAFASVASAGVAGATAQGARRIDVPLRAPDGATVGRLGVYAPPTSFDAALVADVAARIATSSENASRPPILHEINNRIAALLANIELLEILFEGSSPAAPLLVDVPADHRRDALAAVANVADVARGLAALAKRNAPRR